MAWYDFLTGTPARNEQVQRFNPQQQSALSQLLGQGLQGLQNVQNPQNFGSQFDPIGRQARSQFNQQTIPSIAERFTSMGSGSSLSSPAFASQLGQAGAGLEEGLAAQKAGFGLQQQGQQQNLLQSLLGLGLQPQFETIQHNAQPGALQNLISPLLQALLAYGTGGASTLANNGSSGFGGLGQQAYPQGQGFANPSLYSSNMQNLLRPF